MNSQFFSHKTCLCTTLVRSFLIDQNDLALPWLKVFNHPTPTPPYPSVALRIMIKPLTSHTTILLLWLIVGSHFLQEASFGSFQSRWLSALVASCAYPSRKSSCFIAIELWLLSNQTGNWGWGPAWAVHSCSPRASCSAWHRVQHRMHVCEWMDKWENSKRKSSGGTENAKWNPAGELGSMGEVVFELDLERMGRISNCGDNKVRNFR